eukprot:11262-Eustigmatos_ZCMA.PRE.1
MLSRLHRLRVRCNGVAHANLHRNMVSTHLVAVACLGKQLHRILILLTGVEEAEALQCLSPP